MLRIVLFIFVRIRGIEPRSPPWQGGVLPLNHIRLLKLILHPVGVTRSRTTSIIHRNHIRERVNYTDLIALVRFPIALL